MIIDSSQEKYKLTQESTHRLFTQDKSKLTTKAEDSNRIFTK